jgi:hypothetical protein
MFRTSSHHLFAALPNNSSEIASISQQGTRPLRGNAFAHREGENAKGDGKPEGGWRREGSPMVKHSRITVVGAVLVVVAAAASPGAWAGNPKMTTYLTFNRPVALPGAQLAAGTYIFEVANPTTSADLVRV